MSVQNIRKALPYRQSNTDGHQDWKSLFLVRVCTSCPLAHHNTHLNNFISSAIAMPNIFSLPYESNAFSYVLRQTLGSIKSSPSRSDNVLPSPSRIRHHHNRQKCSLKQRARTPSGASERCTYKVNTFPIGQPEMMIIRAP